MRRSPSTVGTENDTLVLSSGNLDAITKLVTFVGGGGNDNRVILNDQVPFAAYSFNLTPIAVTRQTVLAGLNESDTASC